MKPRERKRIEAKVKEWEERWSSVKRWLNKPPGEKPYSLGTKNTYIGYMKKFIRLTGKNPDELASCEDMDKIRDIIAAGLHDEGLPISSSVRYRIHPLNSFWAANGREIKDPYGGIRPHIRRALKRLKKMKLLTPEEAKELRYRLGKERKLES